MNKIKWFTITNHTSNKIIKYTIPQLITLLFLLCVSVLSGQMDLSSQKITENVLIVKGGGANVTVIATEKGLVLIDTFISPGAARRAQKIIQEFSNKPILYAINTHYHADHSFGNQVFSDAVIIGSPDYKKNASTRYCPRIENIQKAITDIQEELKNNQLESKYVETLKDQLNSYRQLLKDSRNFKLTGPEISLQGNAVLKLGSTTFKIFTSGPAHTSADLVVYIPEEKLLVMGDLFWDHYIPYMDPHESDPCNWIAFLDKLPTMINEIQFVVPGHGNVQGRQALKTMQELLQTIWDAVVNAKERGLTLTQAKKEIQLPTYRDYLRYTPYLSFGIESCWNALHRELSREKKLLFTF